MSKELLVAAALAAALGAVPVDAADLHRLWDDECATCHGHAAAFARDEMERGDDPKMLAAFIGRHRGGRSPELSAALAEMLLAQGRTDPEFKQRCGICHPQAADLVRRTLISRDGVLYGRYSGRRIDSFLAGHGRLAAEEAPRFVAVLARIEREVHSPALP